MTGVVRAVDILHHHVIQDDKIILYGDYDTDGLCGLMEYKSLFRIIGFTNYTCVEYSLRTHNVDKAILSDVLTTDSKLVLIADTGSSDLEELVNISHLATVIVADHHELQYSVDQLPNNVCLVNPTALDKYPHLSGACVVYEICMKYLETHHPTKVNVGIKYLTFYAYSALYADSIYGDNLYCRTLHKKALTSLLPNEFGHLQYFNISKRFSLFSFAPPINACFRNKMLYILNTLFVKDSRITSIDRNNLLNEMSAIRDESRLVTSLIFENAKPVVIGKFVLVDLSGFLNQAIPNNRIWDNKGLIANKIADKYKACCICIVSTGYTYTLSCRDYYNRDIYSLFSTVYNVGGHKSAFGGELSFQDVLGLHDMLNLFSSLMPEPTPQVVMDIQDLSHNDILHIALDNEFKHPKDLTLVRYPLTGLEPQWTPDSFSEKYQQFCITVPDKVYLKIEPFIQGRKYGLIHFFYTNRIKGEFMEEQPQGGIKR